MSVTAFSQNLEHWQSLGVRCFLASFFVMIATWLVYLCLRNRSAALRHRVLFLGLGGMTMLPILVLASRSMCPVLQVANQNDLTKAVALVNDPQSNATESFASPPEFSSLQLAEMEEDEYATVTSLAPSETAFLKDASPTPSAASNSAKPVGNRLAFGLPAIPLWSLPLLVWVVVTGFFCIRALLKRIFLARILRNSIIVTEERTLQILRSVAGQHRMRDVPLLCSDTLRVPIAIGVMHPSIVLPAGYGKWSDERLHVVLLHEMMHICRADVLAQSVAGLACTLFWFNPLAWKAAGRMRLERELASDDSVLLTGQDAIDYADHLVEIAAAISRQFRVPEGATAMATHTNLGSRIARLMQQDIDRSQLTRGASTVLLLIAAVVVTCLTTATPMLARAQGDQNATKAGPTQDAQTEATISGDLSADWLEKLKAMPRLEKLVIKNIGANFRASAIIELSTLKILHVEGMPIGSPIADIIMINAVKIPNLRSVSFNGTGITSKGLRTLGDSKIAELSFIKEERLTDDGFKHVGQMQHLEKLYLSGTPIESEGITYLQNCPRLSAYSQLEFRGSGQQVPLIAKWRQLKELELSDFFFYEMVALKDTESLEHLILRNCGANKATESLTQLKHLKRISFDNVTTQDVSFPDLHDHLSKQGIELLDISHLLSELSPGDLQATALARQVHREFDFAKNFPNFWVEWKTETYVPSTTEERIRTLHLLREALKQKPVEKSEYYVQQSMFAWSPTEFFSVDRQSKDQELRIESIRYGDSQHAWLRQFHASDNMLHHFAYNGVSMLADRLDVIPKPLSLSHQSYWFGSGDSRSNASSGISPQLASYRELPSESFDGDDCRVLESAGRNERLWIDVKSGRLRGVLNYIQQGFSTDMYKHPVVKKVTGRNFSSKEEYLRAFQTFSNATKDQLGIAFSQYRFASAIPDRLTVLSDYREVAPNHWFPFSVRSVTPFGDDTFKHRVSEMSVSDLATDRSDLKSKWAPLLPKEGESIIDRRFAIDVKYEFKKDRTAKETEELATAAFFKSAKSAISWEERRNPLNALVGRPASQLPIKGWIGPQPDLQGKSYLLHFWATWCGPCKKDIPLLNELAKNSLVIGVHPDGTPVDEIRSEMSDKKMIYPTIVLEASPKDALGYPVSMYPYCIKINDNGIVESHGTLSEVSGTKRSLANTVDTSVKSTAVGKVIAIDSEEGLVQVSLGNESGLKVQQILDVVRDGKRVAQLRVVVLGKYGDQSIGKVLAQDELHWISSGDTVQF